MSWTARLCLALTLAGGAAWGQSFEYNPPGQLVGGSGQGRVDEQVYVPAMRFPIEAAPAFANSQVWGRGGSQGDGGGQCDAQNYSYPWWDNFCESRQWDMPLCPAGTGHQGQDIRPSTCENRRWWAVAAEPGRITSIGSYSVYLDADSGTRHRYLHMDPASLTVEEGQRVNQGDRLGLVSNAFGGTPTTIHLHYDLAQNVARLGTVYVPPYMSLVRSYERLIGAPAEPCAIVPAQGGVLDNQSRCFDRFGPPATWRYVEGAGEAGDLYWTYAWVNDTPGNWARWRIEMAQRGRYEIFARLVGAYASSRQALYRVQAAGQTHDVLRDLSGGEDWISLGVFTLAEGGDQWVAIYDNTGEDRDLERQIMADAILIQPEAVAPTPDAFLPPPVEDAGVGRPDAFVDDRDAFASDPRDAFVDDRDAFSSGGRDAYVSPFPTPSDGGYVKDPGPDALFGQDVSARVTQSGGCSAGGGHASWLWGLCLLGLLRRRRP